MKNLFYYNAFLSFVTSLFLHIAAVLPVHAQQKSRTIEFPDIPGYVTLKCDFHMHTVFSDGSVWPNIRVQEALMDGLDAISITDHLEHQPKTSDIPNADRNRSYQLAKEAAKGKDLIVVKGAEITRKMPPGHFNAIFLDDANKLNKADIMEAFEETKQQGAFVFWNHPHWTSQQPDGIASLQELHIKLISAGYIHGIEIYNGSTYSDEALEIAHAHNLTLIGNSDIHELIDWQYNVPGGGHRPVTLVFAEEKSEEALKSAMESRRTAVWFDNTLVGNSAFLAPLIENSLEVTREGLNLVQTVLIHNNSDADYILENLSDYTFHNHASVFMVNSHETTKIRVKTKEQLAVFQLRFKVLNAISAPCQHPEISFLIE